MKTSMKTIATAMSAAMFCLLSCVKLSSGDDVQNGGGSGNNGGNNGGNTEPPAKVDGEIDGLIWATSNCGATSAKPEGKLYNAELFMKACPSGWRVPTAAELTSLSSHYSECVTYNGMKGRWLSGKTPYSSAGSAVFFPISGFKDSSGNVLWADYGSEYWSSTKNGGAYQVLTVAVEGEPDVGMDQDGMAYYQLRCVKAASGSGGNGSSTTPDSGGSSSCSQNDKAMYEKLKNMYVLKSVEMEEDGKRYRTCYNPLYITPSWSSRPVLYAYSSESEYDGSNTNYEYEFYWKPGVINVFKNGELFANVSLNAGKVSSISMFTNGNLIYSNYFRYDTNNFLTDNIYNGSEVEDDMTYLYDNESRLKKFEMNEGGKTSLFFEYTSIPSLTFVPLNFRYSSPVLEYFEGILMEAGLMGNPFSDYLAASCTEKSEYDEKIVYGKIEYNYTIDENGYVLEMEVKTNSSKTVYYFAWERLYRLMEL